MNADMDKRDHKVVIRVVTEHEYVVSQVYSPEQAQEAAENMYAEGDEGDVLSEVIDNIDSYPFEEEEEL